MTAVRTALLTALGGVLLGGGFVFPVLWPLSFFGIIPLLLFLSSARASFTWRYRFLFGFVLGVILRSLILGPFFFSTIPLDWLGITDPIFQNFLVIFTLALSVVVTALPIGGFAVFLSFQPITLWKKTAYVASLWILAEACSALFLSLFFWGPQSSAGLHLSIGNLGYLLANDRILLQMAALGGVYVLSFFTVLISVLLKEMIQKGKGGNRKKALMCLAVVFCAWATGHVFFQKFTKESGETAHIAILQNNVPAVLQVEETEKGARAVQYEDLLRDLESEIDIAVMPESSGVLSYARSRHEGWLSGWAERLFSGSGANPLLISSASVGNYQEGLYSQVEYYDTSSGAFVAQPKLSILPYGEYMPYVGELFFKFTGKSDLFLDLKEHRGFRAGKSIEIVEHGNARIATLSCSEVLSPGLYSSTSKEANVFVNTASYAWFHESPIVRVNLERAAKVRAVESRRSYVQATNGAPSFVLDPYGQTMIEMFPERAGSLEIEVPLRQEITPYALLGNSILALPLSIALWPLLRRIRKWYALINTSHF